MPLIKESGRSAEPDKENNELKQKIILTIKRWLFYEKAKEGYDPVRERQLKEKFTQRAEEVKAELDRLLKRFPQYNYLIEEVKEASKKIWQNKSPYSAEDFQTKPKQNKEDKEDDDPRPKCPHCGRRHWPTESHDDSAYP